MNRSSHIPNESSQKRVQLVRINRHSCSPLETYFLNSAAATHGPVFLVTSLPQTSPGKRLSSLPGWLREGRLLPAWVIFWIDIVELQRRLSVDLHNRFSASHREVMHVGIEKRKAPGGERFHLVCFELIPHSEFELSGNYRHVFPVRMPVRRDAESIRHL